VRLRRNLQHQKGNPNHRFLKVSTGKVPGDHGRGSVVRWVQELVGKKIIIITL
jgi:ribosomal protein L21E